MFCVEPNKNVFFLVDGDMSYPFDVNESILWLAELCDMVFVFFDPIGQVDFSSVLLVK